MATTISLDPNTAPFEIQWNGRWVPVIQVIFDAATGLIAQTAIAYDKQQADTPWGLFTLGVNPEIATLRSREVFPAFPL